MRNAVDCNLEKNYHIFSDALYSKLSKFALFTS